MRGLVAFQQMLTKKKQLPKSLLLTLKEADARPGSLRGKSLCCCRRSLPPPLLRRRQANMVKADIEEVNADLLDIEKEEEGNISVETSTGDLPIFTLRSSQVDHASSTPIPPTQAETSFLPPSTTSFMWVPFTPVTTFCTSSPCGPMPGQQSLICRSCHTWDTVIMSL